MPSHQHPDGRWTHTFSSSWLEAYAQCPEKARRRYHGLLPYAPNDLIAIGSAVHAGIEQAIVTSMDGPDEPISAAAWSAANRTLTDIEQSEGFTERKYGPEDRRRLMTQHLETFEMRILPHLDPVDVERSFDMVAHEDPFRTIRFRGRIDYVDAELGPIDWKTAGSPHKVWEKERWDPQSTLYTWAEGAERMRFVVFVHDKDLQTYPVDRGAAEVAWVKHQALQAARMVESGLPYWPMHDAGWWCSEKWCPAWTDCKGAVLGANDKEAA